jgi:hypothetical protein
VPPKPMIYSSLLSVRMINSGYSGYMSGSVLEHTHDMHNGSMPTKTLGLIYGGSFYTVEWVKTHQLLIPPCFRCLTIYLPFVLLNTWDMLYHLFRKM